MIREYHIALKLTLVNPTRLLPLLKNSFPQVCQLKRLTTIQNGFYIYHVYSQRSPSFDTG